MSDQDNVLDYGGLQRYNGKIEDRYARNDGVYEGMTVGNAEQIVSSIFVEDKEPYIFRTAGGAAEIGDRAYFNSIDGVSLPWNQLYSMTSGTATDKGVTVTKSDGCKFAYSGTATETGYADLHNSAIVSKIIAGHKYLITAESSDGNMYIVTNKPYTDMANVGRRSVIYAPTEQPTYFYVRLKIKANEAVSGNGIAQVFDLTLLFGPTIADYIYTVESGTPGAGVALAKKWGNIIKPYYAYNAGSMKSVKLTSHKTVGFNQFDSSSHTAKVIGGLQYKIEGTYSSLSFTDVGGNTSTITPVSGLFTPSANGTVTVSGDGADTCIYIYWDDSRVGDYEPYTEHVYPLDSSVTLRGILKLDANNDIYADGDQYPPSGEGVKNYEEVDLGSLNYTYDANGRFYTSGIASDIMLPTSGQQPTYSDGIISDIYTADSNVIFNTGSAPNMTMCKYTNGDVFFINSAYTDKDTFKAAMSGHKLVYKKATPSSFSADPYTTPQIVDNWGTEQFVVPDQDGVEVIVGHSTKYPVSLKDKIESAPNLPADDGDYILRMSGGQASYTRLASEFPAPPTTDGTYVLTATVADGAATLTWEATS